MSANNPMAGRRSNCADHHGKIDIDEAGAIYCVTCFESLDPETLVPLPTKPARKSRKSTNNTTQESKMTAATKSAPVARKPRAAKVTETPAPVVAAAPKARKPRAAKVTEPAPLTPAQKRAATIAAKKAAAAEAPAPAPRRRAVAVKPKVAAKPASKAKATVTESVAKTVEFAAQAGKEFLVRTTAGWLYLDKDVTAAKKFASAEAATKWVVDRQEQTSEEHPDVVIRKIVNGRPTGRPIAIEV